jgi:hypothetical protein
MLLPFETALIRRQNPEDLYLKHHHHEILKTKTENSVLKITYRFAGVYIIALFLSEIIWKLSMSSALYDRLFERGKVVSVLLTEHAVMKAYGGVDV